MLTWQWVVNWKNDSDLWQVTKVTNDLIAESCSTEFRLGQFVLPLRDRMNLTLFRSCFSAKFGSWTRLVVLFVNWICQLVVGGIVSWQIATKVKQHEFNMLFGKVVFLVYLVVAEKCSIDILMNLTQSSEHDGTAGKFYLTNSHRFRFQKRKKGAFQRRMCISFTLSWIIYAFPLVFW